MNIIAINEGKEVHPVITEQAGNGSVYTRPLTEWEFDGGLPDIEYCEAPGVATAVGKWSWADGAP
jgi:hypothetical protein